MYLGIHFRYDSEEGNKLGKQVGAYVVENLTCAITSSP